MYKPYVGSTSSTFALQVCFLWPRSFFISPLLGIDSCFIIVWRFYTYRVANKWYMRHTAYFYVRINTVYSLYSDAWTGREKRHRENTIKSNNYIYRERTSCRFLHLPPHTLNRAGWCSIFLFRTHSTDNSRSPLRDSQ